jgi:hypothetical protein
MRRIAQPWNSRNSKWSRNCVPVPKEWKKYNKLKFSGEACRFLGQGCYWEFLAATSFLKVWIYLHFKMKHVRTSNAWFWFQFISRDMRSQWWNLESCRGFGEVSLMNAENRDSKNTAATEPGILLILRKTNIFTFKHYWVSEIQDTLIGTSILTKPKPKKRVSTDSVAERHGQAQWSVVEVYETTFFVLGPSSGLLVNSSPKWGGKGICRIEWFNCWASLYNFQMETGSRNLKPLS